LIYTGVGLLLAFILVKVVSNFYSSRYHARRAKELGCQPAFQRPYHLPFGVDMWHRLLKADKVNMLPNELDDIANELGRGTWEQYFLGTPNYVTTDPKNIQAILATQFNDFEIGPVRRGNFFPMLGNGIFTADGKNW
jgi:hypothetical protein